MNRLRALTIASAILLPLTAVAVSTVGSAQAAPNNPAPGTCSIDNSDANYTCKTCTSAGGGVITITCTPKVKSKPVVFW